MRCSYRCDGEMEMLKADGEYKYYRCPKCEHRVTHGVNFWASHGTRPFEFEVDDLDFGF